MCTLAIVVFCVRNNNFAFGMTADDDSPQLREQLKEYQRTLISRYERQGLSNYESMKRVAIAWNDVNRDSYTEFNYWRDINNQNAHDDKKRQIAEGRRRRSNREDDLIR